MMSRIVPTFERGFQMLPLRIKYHQTVQIRRREERHQPEQSYWGSSGTPVDKSSEPVRGPRFWRNPGARNEMNSTAVWLLSLHLKCTKINEIKWVPITRLAVPWRKMLWTVDLPSTGPRALVWGLTVKWSNRQTQARVTTKMGNITSSLQVSTFWDET